jgi:hypothetical protein
VAARYRAEMLAKAEDQVTRALDAWAAKLGAAPPETPPSLPDLDQVTGWSAADPAKVPHGPEALFGGWRAEHQTPEQRDAALKRAAATPWGSKRKDGREGAATG